MSDVLDALIIGAGAAGLLCAAEAGRRGARVAVIEHMNEPGKKILISGGGRCNFTNRDVSPANFLSDNPHFCRSALARYTPADFIALVERHHIAWHEKTLGQLFCDGSARQIVDMLMDECRRANVRVRLSEKVQAITHDGNFQITTSKGDLTARALVVATGGLSIPKIGATGFAHDIARRFGLKVTPLRPALVPLTFGKSDLAWMAPLAGIAADATVSCNAGKFREALLFTHRGLSGPSILQISSYWRENTPILIDFLPGENAHALLRDAKTSRPRAEPKTILSEHLPQRLATTLAARLLPETQMANLPDKTLQVAGEALNRFAVTPKGTEGYAKAEVTLGGIDTGALSSKTMEATQVPGLYAIGEAVDVTGWLGGYNFQWAWASGHAAGLAIAERIRA